VFVSYQVSDRLRPPERSPLTTYAFISDLITNTSDHLHEYLGVPAPCSEGHRSFRSRVLAVTLHCTD
jgi:hypothetical protein